MLIYCSSRKESSLPSAGWGKGRPCVLGWSSLHWNFHLTETEKGGNTVDWNTQHSCWIPQTFLNNASFAACFKNHFQRLSMTIYCTWVSPVKPGIRLAKPHTTKSKVNLLLLRLCILLFHHLHDEANSIEPIFHKHQNWVTEWFRKLLAGKTAPRWQRCDSNTDLTTFKTHVLDWTSRFTLYRDFF